ncbi:MAG: T9SS C-terminal target domain-containing protein [Flavobacteriales bacterium]|nr:MAG: T9SS C-terminal target domain-containing protein [Flavobacteriales bacterium]
MHSCFLLFFTIFTFSSAEACFNQIINNESYDVSPYCGGDMSFAAEFKPTFDFHHVEAQLQYLIGSTWVTYTSDITNVALTSLNDDLYTGKIYDLNGRLLAQKVISQNEALISTSRFAPATYLVVLEDKNGSVLYRNKFFKSN